MALNPFADYFNHADVATASASFSPQGYAIAAEKDIKEGDEIYISYGNYSNDFLLAEYGFVMEMNKWDEVPLDEFILPLFSETQKRQLEETGFAAKYVLDGECVCYRTQLSLRLLCVPVNQWRRLVATGLEDRDKHQAAVDEILLKVMGKFANSADEKLDSIAALDCGLASQRETLRKRWNQVRLLIGKAIARIES